jgi:hypothetical protein
VHITGNVDVSTATGLPMYSLVVTRGAALDFESNDTIPEGIVLTNQALGSVGTRFLPLTGLSVPDPIDRYQISAVAGDTIQILTTTPGGGPREPLNTLVPLVTLLGPNSQVIQANSRGATDGLNALVTAIAPTTGLYEVDVTPISGAGDYTLRVTGASGQPIFSTTANSNNLRTSDTQVSTIVGLSQPIMLNTVEPGDVTVNGVSASSFTVIDQMNIRFTANGVTPIGGGYTVSVAAGAIQDIRETPVAAFSSQTFTGDTVAPTVVASSVTPQSVLPEGAQTFTFTFSEALDPSTIDASDVQFFEKEFDGTFSIGTASTVSYNAAAKQLQAQLSISNEGIYELKLLGGPTGLHDLAGNPLNGQPSFPLPSGQNDPAPDPFTVEFGVAGPTQDFTPLDREDVPGFLEFGSRDVIGAFATSGETDAWSISLDAGQHLALGVNPSDGVQARLELLDPNGVSLGVASGATTGRPTVLSEIPIAVAGIYQLKVTSLAGTGAYDLGLILDASFDSESQFLPVITSNNSIGKAQNIELSAIALDGAATRLAVQGDLPSAADADVYSFQLTAGQPTTFAVHPDFSGFTDLQLEVLNQTTSLATSGSPLADGSVRVTNFIPAQTGTYFVRVSADQVASPMGYDLAITRGATLEEPNPDTTAQDISLTKQALGMIEKAASGTGGAIRVAVLGDVNAAPLVAQLNDDTFYNFDAVAVSATAIDTIDELNSFDVVVIGDPTSRSQLQTLEPVLINWWFNSGRAALVGTGGLITAAGPAGGGTLGGIDSIVPVNIGGGSTILTNPNLIITDASHPITQGVSTFTVTGKVESPLGIVDPNPNSQVLGTVNGQSAVAKFDGNLSRSAWISPEYFDLASTGLRSGSADQLLEQAIVWTSGLDFFDSYSVQANAGDQLTVKTTTPFDGPRLPQNLLDPKLELLNPQGTVVASNDNGAADGKNALINYTVPVGAVGAYTIRVRGLQAGEYTVSVTGATGTASAGTTGTLSADLEAASTVTSDSGLSSGLVYVQQAWVQDFVSADPITSTTSAEEEELLIALPA